MELSHETDALIDKILTEIFESYAATGDGPAAMRGQKAARKILAELAPQGQRAVAKKVLFARFMAGMAPIAAKLLEEEMANRPHVDESRWATVVEFPSSWNN